MSNMKIRFCVFFSMFLYTAVSPRGVNTYNVVYDHR